MALIPAGTFQMGSNGGGADEKPIHRVRLKSFWMYRTLVTVAQYRKFCSATGRGMPAAPEWGWKDEHPIVNVNWKDAADYCSWAKVTLPTEAQWEYAARGGLVGKPYSWGDTWDGSRCPNSVSPNELHGTTPVRSYPANGYGLYEMEGNVWQFCADWYGAEYYKTSPAEEPLGPDKGEERVVRGGAWSSHDPINFGVASRNMGFPNLGYGHTGGFRCVLPGE